MLLEAPRLDYIDRFWLKVVEGPVPTHRPELGPCWLYTGGLTDDGYGRFYITRLIKVRAHRLAYQEVVGVIPDGLVLDHLCLVRNCVNPAHVEPVTSGENTRRGAALIVACVHGHLYDDKNTGYHGGRRRCLACHREDSRRRRAALRAREEIMEMAAC